MDLSFPSAQNSRVAALNQLEVLQETRSIEEAILNAKSDGLFETQVSNSPFTNVNDEDWKVFHEVSVLSGGISNPTLIHGKSISVSSAARTFEWDNVDADGNSLILSDHEFVNNQAIRLSSFGNGLPQPLVSSLVYYVKVLDKNTIQLKSESDSIDVINIIAKENLSGSSSATGFLSSSHVDTSSTSLTSGGASNSARFEASLSDKFIIYPVDSIIYTKPFISTSKEPEVVTGDIITIDGTEVSFNAIAKSEQLTDKSFNKGDSLIINNIEIELKPVVRLLPITADIAGLTLVVNSQPITFTSVGQPVNTSTSVKAFLEDQFIALDLALTIVLFQDTLYIFSDDDSVISIGPGTANDTLGIVNKSYTGTTVDELICNIEANSEIALDAKLINDELYITREGTGALVIDEGTGSLLEDLGMVTDVYDLTNPIEIMQNILFSQISNIEVGFDKNNFMFIKSSNNELIIDASTSVLENIGLTAGTFNGTTMNEFINHFNVTSPYAQARVNQYNQKVEFFNENGDEMVLVDGPAPGVLVSLGFPNLATTRTVDLINDVILINDHGFDTGDLVELESDKKLPTPLKKYPDSYYYVIKVSNNSFGLAVSRESAFSGKFIDLLESGEAACRVRRLAESKIYFDVWKQYIDSRYHQIRMDAVLEHFKKKDYTIFRKADENNNRAFRWIIRW